MKNKGAYWQLCVFFAAFVFYSRRPCIKLFGVLDLNNRSSQAKIIKYNQHE